MKAFVRPATSSNSVTTWTSRLAVLPLPSIGLALCLAAVLRLVSIFLVRSFEHPQTWEFGPLAKSIAVGLGYTDLLKDGTSVPAVFMPPAYSYFLALFFRFIRDTKTTYLLIEIFQAACGVLLVYVVYKLSGLLSGQRAGLAAACLAAIFPTQVYLCNEFHGISIYVVLGATAVYFLVRYLSRTQSMLDIVLAGLCMGAVMLFRGEAPGLVLLYAGILLVRGGRGAVLPAMVFLTFAFACLAPWTVRNYRIFNRLIPVCASGGYNLWIGNNPRATGSQHYNYFEPMQPDVENINRSIKAGPYHRVEWDEAMGRIALQYIRNHPKQELSLALKKLWIYFVFDPAHPKGRNPANWLPSLLLTFLAMAGVWRRRAGLLGNDLFLLGSIGYSLAISVAVFVLPRYKIVVDPFMMIFAANLFTQPARIPQPERGTGTQGRAVEDPTVLQASQRLSKLNSAGVGQ